MKAKNYIMFVTFDSDIAGNLIIHGYDGKGTVWRRECTGEGYKFGWAVEEREKSGSPELNPDPFCRVELPVKVTRIFILPSYI